MSLYSLSVKPMEEYTSGVIVGIWRSISLVLLLTLVLGPVSGCRPGFEFKGLWKGNRNLTPKPGENPALVRTLGQVTLDIDAVGFKLNESGIAMDGTIRYEDGKAYLKILSRLGTPIEKEPKEVQDQMREIELTPRSDGKIDFYDPGNVFFKEPVILTRSAES